jgi:DNA-binding beta-propeller fold protein YncE
MQSSPGSGHLDKIYGRRGFSEGRLQKPRAIAIDDQDQIYIVDMTARIQKFDVDGNYLRGWQTPAYDNGRPTGLTIGHDGRLLVADTHYYRVLSYTPEGKLLESRIIGGQQGQAPGQFGFVTDAVEDSQGNVYVAEYGEYDRIQKFSPQGDFLLQWGSHGRVGGQFVRPQNMEIDRQDRIWVADACNHRIQIFDTSGKLLKVWGKQGSELGELYYPYDLELDDQDHVYICEYGNHRVQKFDLEGNSLGCWGHQGRGEGELHNPWALVRDSRGRIHVLDSSNHRVQRIIL